MTDDEYRINEEHKIEPGEWVKTPLGTIGMEDILRAMGIYHPIEAEDPEDDLPIELQCIAAVNYLIGRLWVASDILFDARDYDPRMEKYLSADAKKEYYEAIRNARRAVSKASDLLVEEFSEQAKVLDVWKKKEGKE